MADKLKINSSIDNEKAGGGDAWAFIAQGEIQRAPATRHNLDNIPPRKGTHLGDPGSLTASDIRKTDGL